MSQHDTGAASRDFQAWAAGRPEARFTDWLRELSEPDWTAATTHRFTRELADDTLPDEVFRRYLIQDYTFVDRFVALLGAAISLAPALPDRIPLAQFAGLVTSEENTYFQRSFDVLGVDEKDRTAPELLPPARGFQELMAEAAGSRRYADALAVLVVAEWSYLTWAMAVATKHPSRPYLEEWITLHANADFDRFVDWLRGQLDREGPKLAGDDRARVVDLFRRAVALEKAFFDAAYG